MWWLLLLTPCLPLLVLNLVPGSYHNPWNDWVNHLWMIDAYRAHISEWKEFPVSLQTNEMIGMAQPLFYGVLFYPLLGVLSLFLGSAIALRLFLIGLWFSFCLFLKNYFQERQLPSSWAFLFLTAIYPLNNLYHRGAIPEFVAFILIEIALLLWMQSRSFSIVGFLFLSACGTHPPTALYSLPFFLLTTPTLKKIPPLIPILSLILILLPTFLVLFQFGPHLYLNQGGLRLFYHSTLDNVFHRLFPFPLDARLLKSSAVSTPFNTTQTHTLLFIALLPFLFRQLRTKLLFALWCFLILASTVPIFSLGIFGPLQFPYRLINFQNLTLLLILLSLPKLPAPPRWIILLSGVGFILKISMGLYTLGKVPELTPHHLPNSFYGTQDYLTPSLFVPRPSGIWPMAGTLVVKPGHHPSLMTQATERGYALINVGAFPWNQIYEDGKWISPMEMFVEGSYLVVPISAGQHRLDVRFQPPQYWQQLHTLSVVLYFLYLTAILVKPSRKLFRFRQLFKFPYPIREQR